MERTLRPATEEDARYVADNMRQADVKEAWALAHLTPREAVRHAFMGSREPVCAAVDGSPVLVAGVAELSVLGDGPGAPWLTATDDLEKHGRYFLRRGLLYVDFAVDFYGHLENFVDARHEKAIQWLRWMSFEIDPPEPFGLDGLPFHRFHKSKED